MALPRYHSMGGGFGNPVEAYLKARAERIKQQAKNDEAVGAAIAAPAIFKQAYEQWHAIDLETYTKLLNSSAAQQKAAVGHVMFAIQAQQKADADQRAQNAQDRANALASRQVATQERAETRANWKPSWEQQQEAYARNQEYVQLAPGQWAIRDFPAKGQTVTVTGKDGQQYVLPMSSERAQELVLGPKSVDPDKAQAAAQERFDKAAGAYQVPPELIANPDAQHAAVYNSNTGKYENAPTGSPGSHIYYGPYLNNADLAKQMQDPNIKLRPPLLPLDKAKLLNQLQANTVTPGGAPSGAAADTATTTTTPAPAGSVVPGISAPGGAPVTFGPAPGGAPLNDLAPASTGNSAADTALAAAAQTQVAMGTAAPLPGLGASMGGAGTPFPATRIPTTFRDVAGTGYVPRAVPVMPPGLATADLIQAQQGPPGTPPPMLAARGAPTPDQIAAMMANAGPESGMSFQDLAGPPPQAPSVARIPVAQARPAAMPQAMPTPPPGSEAASGYIRNPQSMAWSTPVPAGSTPPPSPPAQVAMVHPDGKTVGLVPSIQVPDAIDLGYKLVPSLSPPPQVAAQETPPPVPLPQG